MQAYRFIFDIFFFQMIRRPPRSTHCISSAASDVYKRQYQRRVHGRQCLLCIDASTPKSEMFSISLFQMFWIHPLSTNLDRINDIESCINKPIHEIFDSST
eukprot:TRINITY_DN19903_c0_g1_i1.p3 TRINITY_DN19903_c0_g1~~TRINITY_DN19903_c0_g1_i1.p3  ORF type:complete len:101 (-),score=18.55 TRINITY_DN19903_c0_g1_i1:262-564(-)